MDVWVLLSQELGQSAIEKANLAIQTQQQYFQYQPEMRPWVRPLMEKILGALGYEDIDKILPPEAPAEPRAEAELMKLMSDSQAAGGGGAAPPANQDEIQGATQAMGNSNTQGQNQYQQQQQG